MPNGDHLENTLRRLEAKWADVIAKYPTLGVRFGDGIKKKPWDEKGVFDVGALRAYQALKEQDATPRVQAPPPAPRIAPATTGATEESLERARAALLASRESRPQLSVADLEQYTGTATTPPLPTGLPSPTALPSRWSDPREYFRSQGQRRAAATKSLLPKFSGEFPFMHPSPLRAGTSELGVDLTPVEILMGREKPFEWRQFLQGELLPWLPSAVSAGMATTPGPFGERTVPLPEEPKGFGETLGEIKGVLAGKESFPEFVRRTNREAREIRKGAELDSIAEFIARLIPQVATEALLTGGPGGAMGIVKAMKTAGRAPGENLFAPKPGVLPAVARGVEWAYKPIADVEEMIGAGIAGAGRLVKPIVRRVRGFEEVPTAPTQIDAAAGREVSTAPTTPARAADVPTTPARTVDIADANKEAVFSFNKHLELTGESLSHTEQIKNVLNSDREFITVWHGTNMEGATKILSTGQIRGYGIGPGFTLDPFRALTYGGGRKTPGSLRDRQNVVLQFEIPRKYFKNVVADQGTDEFTLGKWESPIYSIDTGKITFLTGNPDVTSRTLTYPGELTTRIIDDVVTGITENVGGTKVSVPNIQTNVRNWFNRLLNDPTLKPSQKNTGRKLISKYTDLDDAGIDDVLARARVGEVPAPTPARGAVRIPGTVQRIEEPGVVPSFDKPQGLYTSPGEVVSPHLDLGGKRYIYDIDPNANILSIDTTDLVTTNRGRYVGQSAGIGALRRLVGKDESTRFLALSKQEAIEEMTQRYPNVQWEKYFDTQEIAEGYAGNIAKERGYDAIWAIDQKAPEFGEFVVLNKKIVTSPITTTARATEDVIGEVPDVPVTGAPTERVEDVAGGLFRNIGLSNRNRQEAARFLSEKVRPAFIKKFGDAPSFMEFRRQGYPAGENLLAISEAGWHERALAMGLEYVREGAFEKLYRLPGAYGLPSAKRKVAPTTARATGEVIEEVPGAAAAAPTAGAIPTGTRTARQEIGGIIGRGPTEPPTVGIGDNFTNDSVEELRAAHIDHRDWGRGVGELLAGLPGVNTLRQSVMKRVFTPASVARMTGNEAVAEGQLYRLGQAQQQAAASERLLEFGTTKTEGMWARPTRLFDVLTKGPEKGKLLLADGSRKAFGDVAENPAAHRAKGLITTEQEKWITDAHEYIDELARNYQLVSGKQLIFKKGRQHYWPRFVVKEDGKIGVSSEKVFAEQSPGAHRIHETVQEGMESGVKYIEDPLAQLTAYSRAVSKMTRDSIFEKRLLSKNIILPDGTPQAMAKRRAPGARITALPEWQQRRAWGELDITEAAKQQLAQPMGLSRGGFLRGAEMVAAVPKMIVTGVFDTGHFLYQGLPLLFYRPKSWAKATAGALKTMFARSPEDYFNNWMRTGYANKIKDAAAHGQDVSALSEYYQAANILSRVPVVGFLGRRFGAVFHAYMNVGRVEMFDAMATMARSKAARSGQSAVELEGELRRIARIADTIMGGTSTKGLGLSATQRQVENAFIFFAPRFTRAAFGTVAHAAGSGAGAVETRKVLAQMLFGATAIVAGVVGAKGAAQGKSQEDVTKDIVRALDPRSGAAFMSVEIGDQYYGIGGGFRALARLVVNATPFIPGQEGRPNAWGRVMEDVARKEYGDVAMRNPIVMFWRSKAAIPTGSLADYIDREDFIGEEFTLNAFTEDPGKFGRAVMKRTAPFPVQAFVEVLASGSGAGPAVAAGAVEFFGGRQVPVSLAQRREERGIAIQGELGIEGSSYAEHKEHAGYEGSFWEREEIVGLMKESPTHTLQASPNVRMDFLRDEEFVDLAREARRGVRGQKLNEYLKKVDLLFDNEDLKNPGLVQKLNKAWDKSRENIDYPGKAYRLARTRLFSEYYTLLQNARREAEEAGIFGDFDPDGPFAIGADIYNRILFADDKELIIDEIGAYAPLEDDLGNFNWDERERREKHLVEILGQKFVDDMEALSREKMPEFERQRRVDLDTIDRTGYWDTHEEAADRLGLSKKWEAYKDLPEGRNKRAQRDEGIKQIEKQSRFRRLEMRYRDEGLESLLTNWGYVTIPIGQSLENLTGAELTNIARFSLPGPSITTYAAGAPTRREQANR